MCLKPKNVKGELLQTKPAWNKYFSVPSSIKKLSTELSTAFLELFFLSNTCGEFVQLHLSYLAR